MSSPEIIVLNLPSPPGVCVQRDHSGGFGIAFPGKHQTWGYDNRAPAQPPPLELLDVAASLRQRGTTVSVLEFNLPGIDVSGGIDRVALKPPQWIITWLSLPALRQELAFLAELKSRVPAARLLAIGTTARILADEILTAGAVDAICEVTPAAAARWLADHPAADWLSAAGSPLRAVGAPAGPARTDISPLTLDELPPALYEDLPLGRYWQQTFGRHRPYMMIRASRGCPYRCVFCPYPFGVGSHVELRDPEAVVDDIKRLAKDFNVQGLHFRDQVLTWNRSHAVSLCDTILRAGIRLPWIAETRFDAVDPPLLRLLARAGCVRLEYGVETVDERLFANAGKPGAQRGLDQVGPVLRMTERANIAPHLFFLLGFPSDSPGTVRLLEARLREWKPLSIRAVAIKPYPGTAFYQQVIERGFLQADSWAEYAGEKVLVRTETMSSAEIAQALDTIHATHQNAVKWRKKILRYQRLLRYICDGSILRRAKERWLSKRRESTAAPVTDAAEVKRRYADYHEEIWNHQFESPHRIRRFIHGQRYQALLRHIPAGSTLLDVGCGEGVLLALAAQRGVRCVGMDISGDNLRFAAQKLRELGLSDRVTLIQADAEHLPIKDGSFDLVVSSQVLEHLPDLDQGLRELRRVARREVLAGIPTCLSPASWVILGGDKPWRISRKSGYALFLGLWRTIRALGRDGVPEHYGTREELPHLWFFPWRFERHLAWAGLQPEAKEAASLCLPYLGQILPPLMVLFRLLDRCKSWPVLANLGYGIAYRLSLGQPSARATVVHIVQSLAPGGRRQVIDNLARAARDDGIPTAIISLSSADTMTDLHGCPVIKLPRPGRISPTLIWRLAAVLRQLGARVAHAHDGPSHLYASLAVAMIPGCELIMTFHRSRDDIDSPTRKSQLRNRIAALLTSRIVAVSRARAADFQKLHRLSPGKVTAIHNGVRELPPGPVDCPEWPADLGDAPVIGIVAHLGPEKGHDILLAALAMRPQGLLGRAHLIVIGHGAPERKNQLIEKAAELGIAARAHFLGPVANARHLMTRFDIAVLPSLEEAYGLVIAEAMWAGVAVIGSTAGGIPEIIDHGVTGLLVPAGSPGHLAEAMENLLSNPSLRKQLADNGRIYAQKHCTVQRQWSQYKLLYERILGGRLTGGGKE